MTWEQGSGPPGAEPAFGSAANTAPGGTLAELFGTAVAHHQAGALAEAERHYRHILTLYPVHPDTLHNLGLLALQGGDATSAVDLIGRAITLNDRVAEFHYNIALAWRALGRMDHVTAHLEQAIDLRNDHALAHLNLGNVRREQGRLADAVACYECAIALLPDSAAPHFNLANVFSEQGRWDAAIACYQQALAIEPNHAETHSRLGAALMAQGKTSEAISHFEQAVALRPNLPEAYDDLGRACMTAGKQDLAIHAASRALELWETATRKTFFAQCVRSVRFTADNGRFRKLVLRALSERWSPPRELTGVSISLIRLDGAVDDCIARINAAWPTRLPAAALFGPSGLTALSRDELLRTLLECDPITDISVERLLTNVRHAILSASAEDSAPDENVLGFYSAVARQCFINEYVYAITDAEADQAQRLRDALEKALVSGAPCPALWPVAVGAYYPLHTVAKAEALLERSWPESVNALLVQQVEEPLQEREIAATIPVLTDIDDEVSQAVRRQYEESPYPRWVKASLSGQLVIPGGRPPEQACDVLIAGCGTGLSTVEFARHAGNARVLAIDLSLASLSHAKRMAQNFSLTNVEFGQADIMKLGAIGRQFDYIDVSGVLHHLADPWAGWRVLLSLLRPGGAMQVGLYSEIARQNIVAARALIAERGYRPIPDDIRRCREYIIATDEPGLKSVMQWHDFFTTNECRDLLFHAQEHRTTLPEIKSFLAANNAQFAGFILDAAILQRFAARFPERSNMLDLDCWASFETEAPQTFAAMYQFWVRKPAAPPDQTAANSDWSMPHSAGAQAAIAGAAAS